MVSKYIHQLLNKYCNSIIFINPSYKKRLIDDRSSLIIAEEDGGDNGGQWGTECCVRPYFR